MATFRLRDGSGTISLKWIVEDRDRHGNVRIYVHKGKGQPKIRLRERPGSDAFVAEYKAALASLARRKAQVSPAAPPAARQAAPPKSLDQLILAYYRSGEFGQLDERTRYVRRGILDRIRAKYGGKPYAMLESRHVAAWRDARTAAPEGANSMIKALRQLYTWAMLPHVGRAARNPAAEVPYLKPKNADGWHSWTPDEVKQYEERWPIGSMARLALALLLYTGVRRSDLVLLGPAMVRGGVLKFTVSKGKRHSPVHLNLPVLPALQAIIDATPLPRGRDGVEAMTYLATAFGKPFTAAGFGNRMRAWCDAAGLRHCSAHGLRKAGAALAAERGASERQLMAIFGWTTMKRAEHYTKAARQAVLAAESMPLLGPKAATEAPQDAEAPVPRVETGRKPA